MPWQTRFIEALTLGISLEDKDNDLTMSYLGNGSTIILTLREELEKIDAFK